MKNILFFIVFYLSLTCLSASSQFTKELIFQRQLKDLNSKSSPLLMTSCGHKRQCHIENNTLNIQEEKNTLEVKLPTKKVHHLVHHSNYLYMSDTITNNILKLNLEDQSFEWIFETNNKLNYPKEIAISPKDSSIFLADYANMKISCYNQQKVETKFFLYRDKASNELAAPLSISLYQDFLFALYPAEQKLVKFHAKTTEVLSEYNLKKTKLNLFKKAHQINIDLYGFIYIFDSQLDSILVFDQAFDLQDQLLKSSYFYPKLISARSFNIDSKGNLYIQTKKSVYKMKIKEEEFLQQDLEYYYRNSDLKTIISKSKEILKKYPQNPIARKYLLEALELQSAKYIQEEDWDMASFSLKETLNISPSHKASLKKLRIISFKKNKNWILEIFFGVSLLLIFLLACYTIIESTFFKSKAPQSE
ncbi:MAG: hypothetical protein KC646_02725 [Candidatus Cloacimonetes bacterium]|nr:hypothetical protein [Candidatus Cloacimonadota bacterium]